MSAKDLSTDVILDSIQVVVTMVVLGALAIVSVIAGFYVDREDYYALHPNKGMRHSREERKKNKFKIAMKDKIANGRRNLSMEEKFLEDSLPNALQSHSFIAKIVVELRLYHRWVGIVFHYTPPMPRPLRVLMLTTSVFSMLFMQALLYPLLNPDDGSCALESREEACLADPSPMGGGTKCRWSSLEEGIYECNFNPPGENLQWLSE